MSALSKIVTWGICCQLRPCARPSCGGWRSSSPARHLPTSRNRAIGDRQRLRAGAGSTARSRVDSRAWRFTSSIDTRPCGPQPVTVADVDSDLAGKPANRRRGGNLHRAVEAQRAALLFRLLRRRVVGVVSAVCRGCSSTVVRPVRRRSRPPAAGCRRESASPAPLLSARQGDSITWPTLISSPSATWIFRSPFPASEDGTSIVALSVSSSSTGWSTMTAIPPFHRQLGDLDRLDILAQLRKLESADMFLFLTG